MKKLIIVFGFLFCFCTSSFASIVLKNDFDVIGLSMDLFVTNQNTNFFAFNFNMPFTFDSMILWEFDSHDIDKDLHYYCGTDMGISLSTGIIQLGLAGGLNYKLQETEKNRMELDACLKIDYGEFVETGSFFCFTPTCDIVFMPKGRRWIFGGVGVSYPNLIQGGEVTKNSFNTTKYYTAINLHTTWGVRF